MDSRNVQTCEWCHRQLATGGPGAGAAAPAAPKGMDLTQPVGAYQPVDLTQPVGVARPMDLTQPIPHGLDMTQPVPAFRTSLTGEVIPVETAAPPIPGYAPPAYGQPPLPTHAVVRPASVMPEHLRGLPGGAIGTEMVRQHLDSVQVTPLDKWEKALAIMLPVLLVSVWVVHLVPASLPWVVLLELFVVAMALGGTAAIGSYDDAFMDVGVVLIVAFFFGPAVALFVYGIVATIKQEGNGAIVALLSSHLLVRFIVVLAFPMNASAFTLMPALMMFNVIGMLAICATFGGWMLSSFFRPLNE
jgi:hypothetical protein